MDLYENIFQSAPDAIVIVDDSGVIRIVNEETEKLFGYSPTELIGQKIEVLIPVDLRHRHAESRSAFMTKPLKREMGRNLELPALRKDGTRFISEISLSPIRLASGFYVAAAVRDVTDKKEMLNDLRLRDNMVMDQNKRLVNFAHIVSHNLKSFSSNIASLLQLYDDAGSDEDRRSVVDYLRKVSDGLTDTVKHLTEIVSLRADVGERKVQLNLHQYVENTLRILTADVALRHAVVRNEIPDDCVVEYNSAYLESLLLNLLTNALKYSSSQRTPLIIIRSCFEDGHVVMEVSDNGLGIDLAKHGEKLFGMYKTFHGNADARGVGLFITRHQVESMGGSISVVSAVGEGTTFSVRFPRVEKKNG